MADKPITKVAIICGSDAGGYLDIAKELEDHYVETPFGKTTDGVLVRDIEGIPCVILSRHLRQVQSIMSSNINYRANIWALKMEECTHVISIRQIESLQEWLKPCDLIVPKDYLDFTYKRNRSFYDGSCEEAIGECRLPMEPAFNDKLRTVLIDTIKSLGYEVHEKGVAVVTEGPSRSSYAESRIYRQMGGDIISTTVSPEVMLAKELGLLYAPLGIVFQYGPWRRDAVIEDEMTFEGNEAKNYSQLNKIIIAAVQNIGKIDWTDEIAAAKKLVEDNIKM